MKWDGGMDRVETELGTGIFLSEMGLNKSGRQLSDATYGFSLGPTLATISLYLHVEPRDFRIARQVQGK